MLEQLIKMAQERLGGISRDVPELNDLDSKQVTDVTAYTLINNIFLQAKKGNFAPFREMLSGVETTDSHKAVDQLKDPVSTQLQNKLNISNVSAKQLAIIALPIIMNMLNKRVQNAKSGGFNVDDEMNKMNGKSGGILSNLLNMFGGNNQNSNKINTILKNLISKSQNQEI